MLSYGTVLFLAFLCKDADSLRCFQGSQLISLVKNSTAFDNINYEPDNVGSCDPGVTQCMNSFFEVPGSVQGSVFSCDQENLCQAIGTNTCQFQENTHQDIVTCCCDQDLCNQGMKQMPVPSIITPNSATFPILSLTKILLFLVN